MKKSVLILVILFAIIGCDSRKGFDLHPEDDVNVWFNKEIVASGIFVVGEEIHFTVSFPADFDYKKQWNFTYENGMTYILYGDSVEFTPKYPGILRVIVYGYDIEGYQKLNSFEWRKMINE